MTTTSFAIVTLRIFALIISMYGAALIAQGLALKFQILIASGMVGTIYFNWNDIPHIELRAFSSSLLMTGILTILTGMTVHWNSESIGHFISKDLS